MVRGVCISKSICTPFAASDETRLNGAADSTMAFPMPIRGRSSVQLLTMRFSKARPMIEFHPGICSTEAKR